MPDQYGDTNNGNDTLFTPEAILIPHRTTPQVPCRYCHAKPGDPCINTITHEPLTKFTTHLIRIKDASHSLPDDDDGLF